MDHPPAPAPSGGAVPRPAPVALRALVVEDDPVAARRARRVLESLGCEVVVEPLGERAASLLRREPFHLVLLDGAAGTGAREAVRQLARCRGTAGPLLVCVTPSSDPAVRARCLDGGMDEHLAGPLDPAAVRPLLERARRRAFRPTGPDVPFDLTSALRRTFGDAALLRELVAMFVREWPGRRDQIRRAVEAGDVAAAAETAHRLRGSAASVGAAGVVAAAGSLEKAARPRLLAERASAVESAVERFVREASAALPERRPS